MPFGIFSILFLRIYTLKSAERLMRRLRISATTIHRSIAHIFLSIHVCPITSMPYAFTSTTNMIHGDEFENGIAAVDGGSLGSVGMFGFSIFSAVSI